MKVQSSQQVSLAAAESYIEQMDLSNIMMKMVREEAWLQRDVEQAIHMYRHFLYLSKKYQGQYAIVPTRDIDCVWHYHILDTRQYCIDSNAIFGDYHHHYPYFGIDQQSDIHDLNRAFLQTEQLYQKEFAEPYENVCLRPSLYAVVKLAVRIKNHFVRQQSNTSRQVQV